ncbi:hypothetical protein DDP54_17510 [Cellulomonas sp. WB94]|uniref:FAD-binding protein n=1 Tax=Cellulomonas sp. WB94 TaxID=2173174 RepID=UPI000D570746|nr:FAD-binding protein [Cellulomonas sp. WB94]PVU81139.1 hypothetical protein DDP54_17510 [Cellulomonas sp. WB94]
MSVHDTQQRLAHPHPTDERRDRPHPEPRWDQLAAHLTGHVVLPDDPGYDALVGSFNLTQHPHPAAVVQAADADDVVAAVRFAGRHGIEIAPQATGHGATDALDGALLIHTGLLQELQIHAEGWARIGAGVRWQQVLEAAAPLDLMGLAGSSPTVGVVGYVTGGGLSPRGPRLRFRRGPRARPRPRDRRRGAAPGDPRARAGPVLGRARR